MPKEEVKVNEEVLANEIHIDEVRTRLGQAAQMLGFYRGSKAEHYKLSALALLTGIEKELGTL